VFVIGGEVVAQVDKRPAGDEVRVHEHFGGRSQAVPLRDEAVALATAALRGASALLDRDLDYGRVDMMRLADGTLAVSELELVEPGLYLDVLPGNAESFADLVVRRLEQGPRLALAGGEC
jgi:glutathione synthase/RimK-type ligase-like ATP-grasp enzyme